MQRRPFRALMAAAAGLVLSAGIAVPAFAATSSGSSTTTPASISANETTAIGQMTFSAQNTGSGPGNSTGYFKVDGDALPISIPGLGVANQAAKFTLAGPITCLDVQGSKAGFIYPITQATGLMSIFKGQALYITVQAATATQPASVGFAPPGPYNSLKSCPALVPFLTVESGSVTVTPAH